MKKVILSGTAFVGVYVGFNLLLGGISLASRIPSTDLKDQSQLLCFDGTGELSAYAGHCETMGADQTSAKLEYTNDKAQKGYSGVDILDTTLAPQTLNNISELGYDFAGSASPQPWSLSLNIPVDTDGNNQTDTYLRIDAFYCPGVGGIVNVIRDATCEIDVNNIKYANWDALISANPSWTIGAGNAVPFIAAIWTPTDSSASWAVSNIQFGIDVK